MERTPTYSELIAAGMSPEEARKFLMGQKIEVIQKPLEVYVEGPPEVEVKPLREEPIAILPAPELAQIIERLREDAKDMTQVRIDFDPDQIAWVMPVPRFTLFFKKSEGKVVEALRGAKDPEELKEYQRTIEDRYPGYKIERHFRADKDTWFFWAFPPERRHIRRSDPYLLALEVLKLNPKKLSIQTIPRMIRPPKAIPVEALPFGLKKLPSPEAVWRREVPGVRPLTPKEREELKRAKQYGY